MFAGQRPAGATTVAAGLTLSARLRSTNECRAYGTRLGSLEPAQAEPAGNRTTTTGCCGPQSSARTTLRRSAQPVQRRVGPGRVEHRHRRETGSVRVDDEPGGKQLILGLRRREEDPP